MAFAKLYTIGHSNRTAGRLIDLLKAHAIKQIVDARGSSALEVPSFINCRRIYQGRLESFSHHVSCKTANLHKPMPSLRMRKGKIVYPKSAVS